MVRNNYYDEKTETAEYLFDKILMVPERVGFNNWKRGLNFNEKKKLVFKINKCFDNLFKYKNILYKKLPSDILKYIELYILNMSVESFNKFKYFKLNLLK